MSLETISNQWISPAQSDKRRVLRSPIFRRRLLGEKGIGRFAASRLGRKLTLVTRAKDAPEELTIEVDWDQFDSDDTYLDEVCIRWTSAAPDVFAGLESSRATALLGISATHGTLVKSWPLSGDWSKKSLERLEVDLSRLTLPSGIRPAIPSERFDVVIETPSGTNTEAERRSATHRILEKPHYEAEGHFNGNGVLTLRASAFRFGIPRLEARDETVEPPDGGEWACGPFDVLIRAWDREPEALRALGAANATIRDIRRDLDSIAGVNIYRDGFRVLPYGEPHFDWLELDLRRIQNPTTCLSNNQLVGFVLLSADTNPLLLDQTNREGLVDGPALRQLKSVVRQVLTGLEAERYSARAPLRDSIIRSKRGSAEAKLDALITRISASEPRDEALVRAAKAATKAAKSQILDLRESLARFQRLSTLGGLVDVVVHDVNTPLAKIVSMSQLMRRSVSSGSGLDRQRLIEGLDKIISWAVTTTQVVDRVAPFGGRRRGRPTVRILEREIAAAFEILEDEIEKSHVAVSLPEGRTNVTVDQAEIREIIVNLLNNSLYWLKRVPEDKREIRVCIERVTDTELSIRFCDSGPGVPDDDAELIFEPGFTRSVGGAGLGLAIVQDIVRDYYDGEVALVDGPLEGACFDVRLRRRVQVG